LHKGTGLGLSIAQMTVKLLKADIHVVSPWQEDGSTGTKFEFVVPNIVVSRSSDLLEVSVDNDLKGKDGDAEPALVAPAALTRVGCNVVLPQSWVNESAAPGEEQKEIGKPIKHLRIVVAEDEPFNIKLLGMKLAQACAPICDSHSVEFVETGEALLAKMEVVGYSSVELIIVDEHMDSVGGCLRGSEATKALRDRGCKAWVVACSGNCLPQDTVAYEKAGASYCWPKPYPDTASIREHLLEWFGPCVQNSNV
jgi:CheY-like chemotaxis protein